MNVFNNVQPVRLTPTRLPRCRVKYEKFAKLDRARFYHTTAEPSGLFVIEFRRRLQRSRTTLDGEKTLGGAALLLSRR